MRAGPDGAVLLLTSVFSGDPDPLGIREWIDASLIDRLLERTIDTAGGEIKDRIGELSAEGLGVGIEIPPPLRGSDEADDDLTALVGDVVPIGGGNANLITALGGDNVLIGGLGNDTLVGADLDTATGEGSDLLVGGQGNDILRGGIGGEDRASSSAPSCSTS